MPTLCNVRVGPVGKTIVAVATDASGTPVPITALTSNNEVQTIALSGNPAGGNFTLTHSGQTTAAIAAIASDPATYFKWAITVPGSGAYDLWTVVGMGGPYTTTALYEVFDGSTKIGNFVFNQSSGGGVTPFQDPALLTVGGNPVQWYPLGRVTTSGTAVTVRLSGPALPAGGNYLWADCLRVQRVVGGTVQVIGPATPPATKAAEVVAWEVASHSKQVAGTGANHAEAPGQGEGTRYLADPAVVQAALEALSNVGVGDVTVSGNGDPRTPLVVTFTGAMGGTAMPLMTDDDAAVTVARSYIGGIMPSFTVNGDPLAVEGPYWGTGNYGDTGAPRTHTPYLPAAVFVILQDRPAAQYEAIRTHRNTTQGSWARAYDQVEAATVGYQIGGYAAMPWIGMDGSATARWSNAPVPGYGAQYRVSVTWMPDAGFSTSVTYTVRNRVRTVLAALADTGSPRTITTGLGTFPSPRRITATAGVADGGSAGDIKAIQVVITGTDASDAPITETLPAFTVNTPGTVTGSLGFKTVTSVAIPAHDGTGATTSVQTYDVLGTLAVNQTLAPSGATDGGRPWQVIGTYTISGLSDDLYVWQSNGTGSRMVADSVRFERVSAAVGVVIGVGDEVRMTAGAGWMTTGQGPAPAVADAVITNPNPRTPLYPDLPATRIGMRVGMNLGSFAYYQGSYPYYNAAHAIEGLPGIEFNSDGYPTKLAASTVHQQIAFGPATYEADGKSWANLTPGPWVVIWDGACDVTLSGSGGVAGATSLVGTVNKKRYYTFTGDPTSYGVNNFTVHITGTGAVSGGYGCDLTNLRIFPVISGVDVDNPPKWHPSHLARLSGLECMRAMDLVGANAGNAVTWDDFNRPETHLSRSVAPRRLTVPIVSVQAYVGATIWAPEVGPLYKITTVSPHGLSPGVRIYWDETVSVGFPEWSNGTTTQTSDTDFMFFQGPVEILSPTELLFQRGTPSAYNDPTHPWVMTNVLTPTGAKLKCDIGNNTPYSEVIDMVNAAGLDLHLNLPVTLTDEALESIAEYTFANLAVGKVARVAWANEPWNRSLAPFEWIADKAYTLGLGGASGEWVAYYATRSAEVHAIFAGFAGDAGRSGDFIRLMETQHVYAAGTTAPLAEYCNAHSPRIAFDEVAVAPYYENQAVGLGTVIEADFDELIDLLDVDQVLDFYEVNTTYGGWETIVPQHYAFLVANGYPDVEVIFYEGGPEDMIPPRSTGLVARKGERSHAAHRHPRYYGIMMHCSRVFDASGCKLFNFYYLNSGDRGDFHMWSIYTHTTQPAYVPGDATQDLIQVNQFDRTDLVHSVVGGAINAYAALPMQGEVTNATGYSLTRTPTSVNVGSPVTVTATLVGGSVLSAPLVITLHDDKASAISATITINNGSTTGSATVTPSATGTHFLSGTHTGGGFASGDGATSFQATAVSTNATGFALTRSPASVAVGSPVTVTATLTGGTALSSTLTITLIDSLGSAISGPITITNGATTGTATVTPSIVGTHAITSSHLGGGFAGGNGSTSFAATAADTGPDPTPGRVARRWPRGLMRRRASGTPA